MKKKWSGKIFYLLVSFILTFIFVFANALANDGGTERYQQALASAKAEDYEKSLSLFKTLIAEYPENINYLSDYVQILANAGKDKEVIALAEQVPREQVRAYVLEAIARSARNIQNYQTSENFYWTVIRRFPDRIEAYIGLAYLYVDQGRTQDALNIILPLKQKYPEHTEILFAAGYIYERDSQFFEALKYYEKVISINVTHREAIKRRILVTSKLGAPSLAYRMAKQYPDGFFSAEEMATIRWDQAAYWVRWGEAGNTLDERLRFEDTDRAIEELKANIAYLDSNELNDKDYWEKEIGFDLILALRDRFQMQQVIKEAEKLFAKKIELRTEVMIALADAYLYILDVQVFEI